MLMNLEGETKSYSWEHGYPEFDLDEACIQIINFKSEYKPYLIFREGGGFEVFNLEVRPDYSHFPWWNHWPVAQIISDGRSAFAPDRAAHSSLSWGDPNGEAALYGMTDQGPDFILDMARYGMTDQGPDFILDMARSWNNPPELTMISGDYNFHGYDYTQRAYSLEGKNGSGSLKYSLDGSEESPVFNPAMHIENWQGGQATLQIDGQEIPEGKDFRQGIEYDIDGRMSLIIWFRHRSEKSLEIEIMAK